MLDATLGGSCVASLWPWVDHVDADARHPLYWACVGRFAVEKREAVQPVTVLQWNKNFHSQMPHMMCPPSSPSGHLLEEHA